MENLALNITEKEYRELPALSYSTLSRYDREGYSNIDSLFESISTPSLTFGSLVDFLITNPEGNIEDEFVISDVIEPSEAIKNIVDTLYERYKYPQFYQFTSEEIFSVIQEFNYQPSWKESTRVLKIQDLGASYYNIKALSENKKLITPELLEQAKSCVEVLKSDSLTTSYFNDSVFENTKIYYQLKFKGEFENIPIKGMLDIVKVDHNNKKIYLADLKTSKNVYTFKESFFTYRYYMQAEMYYTLVKNAIENSEEYKDYTIDDYYRFIVIDKEHKKPLVFGWDLKNSSEKYKDTIHSWKEVLKDLSWVLNNRDENMTKKMKDDINNLNLILI